MLMETNETELSRLEIETWLNNINAREVESLFPIIFSYAIILIIGVIGNAVVLIVYTLRYKHSPARVYILFLASIDFTLCVFGLPYHLIDLTHPYTYYDEISCKVLSFIVGDLFMMSVFGLIVIAVDRYLKICRPLGKVQVAYFGRKRACGAAVLASLLISWPFLVLYGPSEMETQIEHIKGYACFFHTSFLETNFPLIFTLTILGVCVISTATLIILYSCICHNIITRYKAVLSDGNDDHLDDTTSSGDYNMKTITSSTPLRNSPAISLENLNGKTIADNKWLNSTERPLIPPCIVVYQKRSTTETSLIDPMASGDKKMTENLNIDGRRTERIQSLADHLRYTVNERTFGSDSKLHIQPQDNSHTLIGETSRLVPSRSYDLHCFRKKYDKSNDIPTRHALHKHRRSLHVPFIFKADPGRRGSDMQEYRNGNGQGMDRSSSMSVLARHSAMMVTDSGLRVHGSSRSMSSILKKNATPDHKRTTPFSKQHYKITKIMLTITVAFIMCYTPVIVLTLW